LNIVPFTPSATTVGICSLKSRGTLLGAWGERVQEQSPWSLWEIVRGKALVGFEQVIVIRQFENKHEIMNDYARTDHYSILYNILFLTKQMSHVLIISLSV